MFDLGFQELVLIFVVSLLVLGPKKLPEFGRTLGKGMAEFRRAFHGLRAYMDSEIKDIQNPVKSEYLAVKDEILSTKESVLTTGEQDKDTKKQPLSPKEEE